MVFSAGQTSETYQYKASAGQYLTLDIADGTWASEIDAELKMYEPNGNFVIYTYFGKTGWTGEVGPLLAGRYAFDLTATSESTAESAEFYFATDQTGVVPTDGTSFEYSTQEPGQYARFAFSASAGQTFTMTSTGNFDAECDVTMYLLDPAGTNEQYSCTGLTGYFDYTVPTSGTWTMEITNPDIESGSVTMNATLTPEPGGYGYVLADKPTAASYQPSSTYSKNSTGAHNTVTREGTGDYVVTFPGVAATSANGGTVDVTGYDTSGSCQVGDWLTDGTGVSANILCFAPGGAAQDSEFEAVFASAGTSSPTDLSYLWADQPTSASYTPDSVYQFNSGGGTDTITLDSTGNYTVAIPNIGVNAGTVKVTAYGDGGVNCDVGGWYGSPTVDVNVLCTDASGDPVDAYYSMTWVNDASLLATTGGDWGYVWANEPTTASYTPDPTYQANSSGATDTIYRSGTGSYAVDFPHLGKRKGDVQVTAYASGAVCNFSGWTGSSVAVRCYDVAGAPEDSDFTVQYVA